MTKYDVFICHASEDKEDVARPLAEALHQAGVQVWYDEFELRVGDSLSESIDAGVAQSRFGVVIISKRFLEKPWPKRELRSLVSRELYSDGKVILPVWHEISKEDVLAFSPALADVLAVSTSRGLDHVTEKILEVVQPDIPATTLAGGGGDQSQMPRFNRLSASRARLDGEYLDIGRNAQGGEYRGRATIKEHDGIVMIVFRVDSETYLCHGRRNRNRLKIYGDSEVEYVVKPDGSLVGAWGNGGIDTLIPIEKPRGAKKTVKVKGSRLRKIGMRGIS